MNLEDPGAGRMGKERQTGEVKRQRCRKGVREWLERKRVECKNRVDVAQMVVRSPNGEHKQSGSRCDRLLWPRELQANLTHER